jgi:pimeloyl-ACP methyl ester carboxylesterase
LPVGAILACLVLVGVSGRAWSLAQANTHVSLRTSDWVSIAATLYLPSRRPAPAVILLHMLGRSRDDWQPLAARMADAGLAAMAIDLRGHGASSASPEGSSADLSRDLLDVQAARAYLKNHAEIATDKVGMAGASIGANLAVLAAASDATVRSLALLSAGLDYRGLRIEAAMKKYNERPALIVVSQEDPYPLRSAKVLTASGSGPRELKLLDGAGHGTVMLTRQPDLIGVLVDWFQRTLL